MTAPDTRFSRVGIDRRAFLPLAVTEETAPGGRPVLVGQLPDLAFLTDAENRAGTGVLAAAIDSLGGLSNGLAVLPRWIVTTNLTMRRSPSALMGPVGTGPLVLRSQVLRTGRSAAVSKVTVTDERDVEVATSWLTSAALEPEDGPPRLERPFHRTTLPLDDDPAVAPRLEHYFGLEPGAAPGEGRLEITPERRNNWGILLGGGVAVLLDATAASLAAGVPVGSPTPHHAVTDLVIHYLSPGRVGPVVATAMTLGRHGRDELVRLEVRDTGADNRPLTTAVATVRHRGSRASG